LANKKDVPLFTHSEFEDELKKGTSELNLTKDTQPLTKDELASSLSDTVANADSTVRKPFSVAIESNKNVTWLALPATAGELNRALMDIDALTKDYAIVDFRTSLNIALGKVIIGGDINEVNYLAARLAELPQVQIEKLEAVAENPENLVSLAKMIDFTYNTDFYVLIPEVRNTEDLARYYIHDSGMVEMPRQWKDAIDLYAFGTNIEEQEKGTYTEKGYLLPTGDQWRQVFEKLGVVPPEYRVDNYLKTAEMSTEQNYNQIDGVINNKAQPDADLTDGQTYDEIQELAPETLVKAEKPSIIEQLKEAQESLAKPDTGLEKKQSDLEL